MQIIMNLLRIFEEKKHEHNSSHFNLKRRCERV